MVRFAFAGRVGKPEVAWLAVLCVLALLTLGGCQGGYGPFYDAPEIEAGALQARLAAPLPPLVIDGRDASEFAAGHIPGAVRVEVDDVEAYLKNAAVPTDRFVVIACERGHSSLSAVAAATRAGHSRAHSLRGGMLAWPASATLEQGAGAPVEPALLRPPLRAIGFLDQIVIAMAGLVLKPTYMLLSLVLVGLIWRVKDRGLRLVRAAMAAFFAGEAACALNYILTAGTSLELELAHGLGMVAMGTLLTWGLAVLVDERIIHYEDSKAICVSLRFCLRCWKREPVSCPFYRLMLFAGPALAGVSLLPLCVAVVPESVRMTVFGSESSYSVPLMQQLVQFRLYPIIAAASFLVATAILLWRWRAGVRAAQLPFFLGVGFGSFALGRFILTYAIGREMPGWADLWEEITELLVTVFVLVLLGVLWHRLDVPPLFARRRRKRRSAKDRTAAGRSQETAVPHVTDSKQSASDGEPEVEPLEEAGPKQALVSEPRPAAPGRRPR